MIDYCAIAFAHSDALQMSLSRLFEQFCHLPIYDNVHLFF